MTTPTEATDKRAYIVLEFEFPETPGRPASIDYNEMMITIWTQEGGGGSHTGIFDIGTPDAVLYDNVASLVEARLLTLDSIVAAKVTITGSKWRIEVTEGSDDAAVAQFVGLYKYRISLFHSDHNNGGAVGVQLQQREVDPPDPQPAAPDDADAGDETPPEDQPDPESDGDGGDDPEAQPGPDPEGQPGPEPGGNGGALTNVDADDGDGLTPQQSILQQHLNLLKLITSGGATGRLDAGDLSIGGGVNLPASDDSLHRSSYHLYYHAEGGSYFLRFDDAITTDLPVSATAAQVDAALEGLDGVTSAEVSGEPGNFTIALTADEPHVLQWGDLHLDGNGQLDYLMA